MTKMICTQEAVSRQLGCRTKWDRWVFDQNIPLCLSIQQFRLFLSHNQGGITCGAIDEPRKSSKAIDERVIIKFRDKNVVIVRFRDKNVVIARFHDKNVVIASFRDKNVVIARFRDKNVVNARFRDKNVEIACFRDKNVVIARFCDKNVVIARFS